MKLYRIAEVPDPDRVLADLIEELLDNSALVVASPDYEAGARARFASEWDRLDWDTDTSPSQRARLIREATVLAAAALTPQGDTK